MENALEKLISTNENYRYRCLEAAMESTLTLLKTGYSNDVKLVHANLLIGNEVLAHAWAEVDNELVIDLTQEMNARIVKIDDYYEQAKIQKMVKYTYPEFTLEAIRKNDQYGPWEDWLILLD